MSWFNKKSSPFEEANYIEIETALCNKKDCKNYSLIKIVTADDRRTGIGVLYYRDINLNTCLICEHLIRKDCYITWQDSAKNT